MKKKTLSLALALALCLGLTVPALADEEGPISVEEGVKNISITANIGELSLSDLNVEKPWTMISYSYDEETWDTIEHADEVPLYRAIRPDTQFTVSHTGTVDDGTILRIYVTPFIDYGDGRYAWMEWPHRNYLCKNGTFLMDMIDPDGIGGLVELKAGESVTFSLPFSWMGETGQDIIFELRATMHFPQYEWSFWSYSYYKADEAAYNAAVAKGPAQPDQPDQPQDTPLAKAGNQDIEIDGTPVAFQTYMLADENGNGTNYVKLRDIAHVLNGTGAQFSVGYNRQEQSISATTGEAYQDTGTEMDTPFAGADKEFVQSQLTIVIDGKPVQLDAITLSDDAGNGYNYFKLRDLGDALGFTVGYSRDRGVYVETR